MIQSSILQLHKNEDQRLCVANLNFSKCLEQNFHKSLPNQITSFNLPRTRSLARVCVSVKDRSQRMGPKEIPSTEGTYAGDTLQSQNTSSPRFIGYKFELGWFPLSSKEFPVFTVSQAKSQCVPISILEFSLTLPTNERKVEQNIKNLNSNCYHQVGAVQKP